MAVKDSADDIAGLSERLREQARRWTGIMSRHPAFSDPELPITLCEAAADIEAKDTQLDSLLKERDALQARVKELEGYVLDEQLSHGRTAKAAREEVARLQQERDEAVKALDAILSANDDFRAGLPQDWEGDPLQDACDTARDLVRRLAGPEKIAAANDGEERR